MNVSNLVSATEMALRRREPLAITFVNPWVCAKWREYGADYGALFGKFDYVCCDGIGMVVAAKLTVPKSSVNRVSFDETSFAGPFFTACAANGREVVLVGGEAGVASAAAVAISEMVPGLVIAAAFDGFDGTEDAIRYLASNPIAAVVCGMGTPRQEQFLIRAAAAGWAGVGATCGGFLDQVNTARPYYPTWVDRFQMRWAYRLWREPRRLWRRYFIEYWPFALALVMQIARRIVGRGAVLSP